MTETDAADPLVLDNVSLTLPSAAGPVEILRGLDVTVGRGTAAIVANVPGAEVNRLISADSAVTDVRIESGS